MTTHSRPISAIITPARDSHGNVAFWTPDAQQQIGPAPELLDKVVADGFCDGWATFWFNHEIYHVEDVRRHYTDRSGQPWVEIQAFWSHIGDGEDSDDDRIVVSVPLQNIWIDVFEENS